MAKERGYAFRRSKALVLDRLAGRHEGQVREWSNPPTAVTGIACYETPGGGIAAKSGSTLGSATCTLLEVAGGTRSTTATTTTVYNEFLGAIAGNVDIIAAKINGIWIAIAEDCDDTGGTTPTPTLLGYTVDNTSVPP